jgi:hypothetical protein
MYLTADLNLRFVRMNKLAVSYALENALVCAEVTSSRDRFDVAHGIYRNVEPKQGVYIPSHCTE